MMICDVVGTCRLFRGVYVKGLCVRLGLFPGSSSWNSYHNLPRRFRHFSGCLASYPGRVERFERLGMRLVVAQKRGWACILMWVHNITPHVTM